MTSVAAALGGNDVMFGGHAEIHGKPSGWKEVKDVDKDSHLQELGNFAVTEHNQQTYENLRFLQVTKAEVLEVGYSMGEGKYTKISVARLGIMVARSFKMFMFSNAMVLDIPLEGTRKLLSFELHIPGIPTAPRN